MIKNTENKRILVLCHAVWSMSAFSYVLLYLWSCTHSGSCCPHHGVQISWEVKTMYVQEKEQKGPTSHCPYMKDPVVYIAT
jgi:hypothetical protein